MPESEVSLIESYENYLSVFADLFVRREPREHFSGYIRGLLSAVSRKNCWQLAEKVGYAGPQQLQRLLTKDQWSDEEMSKHLRDQIAHRSTEAVWVGVVDESGFVKKGDHSAGVARQYCGRVGKVENCQVGVYLSYVSGDERGLLDRELYLPQVWCEDADRRRAARIPDTITFQTKPQLGLQMLERVWSEGLPLRWVTADTTYGNSPLFRNQINHHQRQYVLAVAKSTPLQRRPQATRHTAFELAARIPPHDWQAWSMVEGEKGEIWYEWARLRVHVPNDEVGEQWLLIRRPLQTLVGADFFLSNAPSSTDLLILAQVASQRHSIEEVFEDAKSQVGMADYETRYWHSWYRHMTLVMVALTWLTWLQHPPVQKKLTAPNGYA